MKHAFSQVLEARLTRRTALTYGAALGAATTLHSPALWAMAPRPKASHTQSFALSFPSVTKDYTADLRVANGYKAKPLMRWGDPVLKRARQFSPADWTAEAQSRSFGYNNDFLAYIPLKGSEHGLLHVNHEYTNAHLMFADVNAQGSNKILSEEQLRIEQQAQGFSTIEIKKNTDGEWVSVPGSRYAKRVTATTPIRISGPATGKARLRTSQDPQGRTVFGTFANCAGGVTPWGTVLVSEENIDGYFVGKTDGKEAANHKRYTIARRSYYGWQRIDKRFDVSQEPNEPNRFGWVVEYDPRNPRRKPIKRTALGRFKHESATCTTAPDGRAVVYSGDDDYFEYLYRFVSRDSIYAGRFDVLDYGTLSVAKFNEDGSLEWIALTYGKHGLTPKNGFHSQADVVIEARRAGDVVGATKMDRPEGIAIHPQSAEVFVSLTKNPKRKTTNAANPRANNKAGHIVKMMPPAGDHAADKFRWDIHLLAGDPDADAPNYNGRPSKAGWFGNPDNLAFHPSGSLWIATDGMPKSYGFSDGLFATDDTSAPRCFLAAPKGAEVTGPCFTPDGNTLFVSIQHPGEDKGSTFNSPSTRWPDFDENLPPRPTVVAITKAS